MMQIIQAPNSEAQTLAEIFGVERRIKLFPLEIDLIPLMFRYLAEGQAMQSDDFPDLWDVTAWLLLKEYPNRIFFVMESPDFEPVNRYIPDSLVPLFEPKFYKLDVNEEEQ